MKSTMRIERILNNPFCILGLPCNAQRIEIIKAQEKLNKLSRIGAESCYTAVFYSNSLPTINRTAGIIQAAMAKIDEPQTKLFWFVEPYYIINYGSWELKGEFICKRDLKEIKYDCFLANYLYLIVEDHYFDQIEYWKILFNYIGFLFSSDFTFKKDLLFSRYQLSFSDDSWDSIITFLPEYILSPIKELAANSEPKYIIKMLEILPTSNIEEFKELKNNLSEQLILAVQKEYNLIVDFVDSTLEMEQPVGDRAKEAIKLASKYNEIVEHIIEPLDRTYEDNSVTTDRIKDIFYKGMINLMDVLCETKRLGDAYACATQADRYAPSHKKSELKNILADLKSLEQTQRGC